MATTTTPATFSASVIQEAQLMTATIHKEYGSTGGITLRQLGAQMIIARVDDDSDAAAQAPGLKRGMHVLSMNNVDCSMLTEASAQQLLESDELVTFLVSRQDMSGSSSSRKLLTAVITKETKDDKVGLSMKTADAMSNACLLVGAIREGSKAATQTDLQPGMIILAINNVNCVGLAVTEAAALLTDAAGHVTILAQPTSGMTAIPQRLTDHVTATVVFSNDSSSGSIGLELMKASSRTDGSSMILIKSIDPQGPFFGTALRVGMQILMIQNMDCRRCGLMTAEQVTTLLQDCAGEPVTILAQQCSSHRRAPGSFMTVAIRKETQQSTLGVLLALKAGKLMIKKIGDGTLASTTELEPNMIVHSINNVSFTASAGDNNRSNTSFSHSHDAAEVLKAATGWVTFLVETPGATSASPINPKQMVAATMFKKNATEKVGLAFKPHHGEGLTVTKLIDGGLACNTSLKVGMKLLQINNVDCTSKKSAEAAELLANTQGVLTVVAQKPDLLPGTYVVASVKIPESSANSKPKVGLKFKMAEGENEYVITDISEDGLAAGTDLQVGMLLKSVNNVDCASKKSINDVLELFQQLEAGSTLNLLAVVPGGLSPLAAGDLVTGMVKTEKNVPEGSLEYRDEDGRIMVTDEGATGFLHGTAIRSGMEILTINNVEASVFSKAALDALFQAQDQLVFLAKRQAIPKGLLLTEVLNKASASDPVGIGLSAMNKKVMISSIKDGSLASPTKLLPGMEILSINNEDCMGADAMVVGKMLRDAVGPVAIVASTKQGPITKHGETNVSLVTAILEKSESKTSVGLGLVRKRGKLVITKIAEDGLAFGSHLLVGMELLTINNQDVTEMASHEAGALMAGAEGTLTILAKRPSMPTGSYVTAAITMESQDSSIGIVLATTHAGKVVIRSIIPQSPASFTELEATMLIKSINNVDTSMMALNEVAQLLSKAQSPITILAQTTTEIAMGRASYVSMRRLSSTRSMPGDNSSIASSLSGTSNHFRIAQVILREQSRGQSTEDDVTDYTPPVRNMPAPHTESPASARGVQEIREIPEDDVRESPTPAPRRVVAAVSQAPTTPTAPAKMILSVPKSPTMSTTGGPPKQVMLSRKSPVTVADTKMETITIIQGGRRESFKVQNVVDC